MPPKKTEMQKLREKLKKEKQKQKKILDLIKSNDKKKKKQPAKTVKGLFRKTQEDVAIREFFKELINTPDDKIIKTSRIVWHQLRDIIVFFYSNKKTIKIVCVF